MSIPENNKSFLLKINEKFPDTELSIVIGLKNLTPKLYSKLTQKETIAVFENVLAHLKKEADKKPETLNEAADYYIRHCDLSMFGNCTREEFISGASSLGVTIQKELGFLDGYVGLVKLPVYKELAPKYKTPEEMGDAVLGAIYDKLHPYGIGLVTKK